MIIQQAVYDDLPEILDLQKFCYQENARRYNNFSIQPLTQTLEELQQTFADFIYLKIVEDERIVGSVRACKADNVCLILKLIVHPDYQNRGYGSMLLREIEGKFRRVSHYELFTGYRDEKNLHLYQKAGYVLDRERKHENPELVYLFKPNKR